MKWVSEKNRLLIELDTSRGRLNRGLIGNEDSVVLPPNTKHLSSLDETTRYKIEKKVIYYYVTTPVQE